MADYFSQDVIDSFLGRDENLSTREKRSTEKAAGMGLFVEPIPLRIVSQTPQAEAEPKKPGFIKTAGSGLMAGMAGIGESLGTATEYIGRRTGIEPMVEAGRTASDFYAGITENKFAPSPEIAGKNIIDNPELLANSSWWVYNIAQMLPSLAATIIPAGVVGHVIKVGSKTVPWMAKSADKLIKLGQHLTGFVVGGALEGSQTYREVLKNGGSEQEAARAGEAMFIGAGALNAIGTGKILNKAAGDTFKKKIVKHLGAGAWEGLTEGLEEPTEVLSKVLGKYLAGEELPANISAQMIESLKVAATVAPIAAVTGLGGSVVSGIGDTPGTKQESDGKIFTDIEKDVIDAKATQDPEEKAVKQEIARTKKKDIAQGLLAGLAEETSIKSAAESASVFQEQPSQAPAADSAATFEDAGLMVDPVQEAAKARQRIIDRTYIPAEDEIDRNRLAREEIGKRAVVAPEKEAIEPVPEAIAEEAIPRVTESEKVAEITPQKGEPVAKTDNIPKFSNTDEAVKFGETATPEQVKRFAELRKAELAESEKLSEAEDYEAAMIHATNAQFYREAIEASKGEHPSQVKSEIAPQEPAAKAKEPTPAEAKVAFETAWQKQYGDRPKTVDSGLAKPKITEQAPELTLEEAKKVAKMSDAELAEYNAKQVKVKAKEPYEMSREEYGKERLSSVLKSVRKTSPMTKTSALRKKAEDIVSMEYENAIHKAKLDGKIFTKEIGWQQTKAEIQMEIDKGRLSKDYLTNGSHERFIQQALSEGKPVPSEVLKDYPDLTPEPETPKKVTGEAAPEKAPEPKIGTAWINEQKKPIMAAKEITVGKKKGMVLVTLTRGRNPDGSIKPGLKKKIARDKIVEWPGEAVNKEIKSALKPAEPTKVEQKKEPESKKKPGKLEDFGEKIGGARKDVSSFVKKELSDDDIANQPLSKIWPKSQTDSIEDNDMAAIATAIRGEVPSKPRTSYKLRRWVEQVKAVKELMRFAEEMGSDQFLKKMAERSILKDLISKIKVLQTIDRKDWNRIGRVSESPDAYSYGKGTEKIPSPFVSVDIDGRYSSFKAKSVSEVEDQIKERLSGETPEKKMKFEVRGTKGKYQINKTGDPLYRPLKTFADLEEARKFQLDNYDALVMAWEQLKEQENVKETDVRSKENRPRVGADHRKGKDATPEMFMDSFGFRGVEFGNWVSQGKNIKERQGMLNAAYDAIYDLADILDIPTKAISLNGELGLGLGSRGHGWASAHYEPDFIVINLTKTRGAGSIAHEFFHALDHYFHRMRGTKTNIAHGNYITYQPETYYQHKNGQKISASRFNQLKERKALNVAEWKKLESKIRPEVSEAFKELVDAINASPMSKRSALIDKGKSGGYWSRIIERAARSFENYIIAKMAEKGYHNDYLANVAAIESFARDPGRYPYLLTEELPPIKKAFDNLFATVESKETEKGTALFSTKEMKPVDTKSAEFKRWIGNSVIKHPVYHWTDYEFDQFDVGATGGLIHFGTKQAAFKIAGGKGQINYDIDQDGDEFWVTADSGPMDGEGQGPFKSEIEARAFIKKQPKTIEPMAVYLKLENPLRVPDFGIWTMNAVREHLYNEDIITKKEADAIWKAWQKSDNDGYQKFNETIKKHGYDGFVYVNEQEDVGSDSYVVIEPTQIKSAISNTGEFSETDPRIQYQTSPTPEHISLQDVQSLTKKEKRGLVFATTAKQKIADPTDTDIANFLNDSIEDESLRSKYTKHAFEKIGGALNALYNSKKRVKVELKTRILAKQRLSESLEQQLGEKIDIVLQKGPSTAEQRAVTEIAKALGLNAYFFKTSNPAANSINGLILPNHPETIYLNFKVSNPSIQVMGHEFVHSLKRTNPDLYDFLHRSIQNNVVDFDSYLKNLNRGRLESMRVDEGEGQEELYGDFLGDQLTKASFWNKLAKEDPSLTHRLARHVRFIIDKIKRAITRHFPASDIYFKDINHAQYAIAKIISETARRVNAAEAFKIDSSGRVEESTGPISDLVRSWEQKGITAVVTEGPGTIDLHTLIIPEKSRGMGAGSTFMNEVIDLADYANKKIELLASEPGTAEKDAASRLRDFYKKFGFEVVRSEEDGSGHWMERSPQEYTGTKPGVTQEGMSIAQTTAYTGSPASYDKPSTDYIGTGEGAAAFGWGLYFSDKEAIARHYAKATGGVAKLITKRGGKNIKVDPQKAIGRIREKHGNEIADEVDELVRMIATGEISLEMAKNEAFGMAGRGGWAAEAYKLLRDVVDVEKSRNLYKVTLHKGKEPGEYTWLDWYEKVGTAVKNNLSKQMLPAPFNSEISESSKIGIKNSKTGEELYRTIANILGSKKEASLFLLRAGIDGIRYPAESLSGGATKRNIYAKIKGLSPYEVFTLAKKLNEDYGYEFNLDSKDIADDMMDVGGQFVESDFADAMEGFGWIEKQPHNYVVFDADAVTIDEHIQFQTKDNTKLSILKRISENDREIENNMETRPEGSKVSRSERERFQRQLDGYKQIRERENRQDVGQNPSETSWENVLISSGGLHTKAFEEGQRTFAERGFELIPVKNSPVAGEIEPDLNVVFISFDERWGSPADTILHELFHLDVIEGKEEATRLVASLDVSGKDFENLLLRYANEAPWVLAEMRKNAIMDLGYGDITEFSESQENEINDLVVMQVAEEMAAEYVAGRLPDTIFKETKTGVDAGNRWTNSNRRYSSLDIQELEKALNNGNDPKKVGIVKNALKLYDNHIGKGYTASKDANWLQRLIALPYWQGQRFKHIGELVDDEINAKEQRNIELTEDYAGELGEVQEYMGKNPEDLKKLTKLIWLWDGVRFNKKDVPTDWYEIKEDENIHINQQHYAEVEAYLEKRQVPKDVIRGFIAIRKALDRKFVDAEAWMKTENIDPTMIEEYRSNINKIHNYFPHRRHGDSFVTIVDISNPEERKVVYYEQYNSLNKFKNRPIQVRQRAGDWIDAVKKTGLDPNTGRQVESPGKYIIRLGKVKEMPQELFFQIPVEAMQQLTAEAGKRMTEQRVQYEAERLYNAVKPDGTRRTKEEALKLARSRLTADFDMALSKAVAEVFKVRGWGRHAVARKNIPGFETEDAFGSLFDYMAGYAGFKTKIIRAKKHHNTLSKIDAKKNPEEWKYASKYVKDMLSNQDRVDRAVDTMRGLFFVKYLGFVPKSGIVNLTQNIVLAAPYLSTMTKHSHRKLSQAMFDVKRALISREGWTGKEVKYPGLTENEQKAIKEFHESGASIDQYLRELKGNMPGIGWGKHFKKVVDYSGVFMQLAERFNRTSAGLVAYRVGVKEKNLSHDGAVAFAKDFIYKTHFLYGKENLPPWARGGDASKVARAAYTFRSFTMNYLSAMAHLFRNQEYGAMARSMRNILVVGGLTSIPFFKVLSDALLWVLDDDDEDALTKAREMMPANWLKDMVVYGLPGVGGYDLSGSLSIEIPRSWSDILGVPYAVAEDTQNMYKSWSSGQKYRALSETPFTPITIRNAMRAIELFSKGQTSRSGRAINAPGEVGPRNITAGEAIGKGLFGLQPTSSSKGYASYSATMRAQDFLSKKKQRWADRYANAAQRQDVAELAKIRNEVRVWNERVVAEGKNHLTVKLKGMIKSRQKRPGKELPKNLRREAGRIASQWQ